MLQDVIHPPSDHLQIDDVSSPFNAQILEFCDPEFFQETLQNSDVTSSSNCCYEENSSYAASLSLPPDFEKFNNNCQDNNNNGNTSTATHKTTSTTTTTTSTATTAAANTNNISNNNNNSFSIIFDSQDELDNEISASIDFSSTPTFSIPQFVTTQQDQFDFSSVQHQLSLSDMISANGLTQYPADSAVPFMGPPLTSVFEEDCLSSIPSYLPLNPSSPSCAFLGPAMSTYMSAAGTMTASLSVDSSGIFAGGIFLGSELQPQEMEYQGENGGIYCPDSIPRVFNPGDLQALGNETQQLVGGAASSTPLTNEISSLEDSSFKVGKLSVEQRKEKIHRYMKKRSERNFSKKIKYACRKTLADSRPRVRGRFAKNDDFGETTRAACSNHEEDDEDEMVVKEEDDMVDSADILAHISGVNSFKCNYSIQSWI
ncbi:two-component response regulator-like APRR7 isoform X2 [Jatropha curcas]|uniref:two-component response regulator-like APRR7 isoform X2 n=1 Tax=Jatropha curcas TaxID=180498 RepID=UPI0009D76953|nr:two-component response regulator-like APRR7 isoform X2 [Jatropha curcas]